LCFVKQIKKPEHKPLFTATHKLTPLCTLCFCWYIQQRLRCKIPSQHSTSPTPSQSRP